jgi:hypothetical protein
MSAPAAAEHVPARPVDPRPVLSIDPCPGCPWQVVQHVGEGPDEAASRHQAGALHTAWRTRHEAL